MGEFILFFISNFFNFDKMKIAMQNRCLNCWGEVYSILVYPYSHGEVPCDKCGKFTTQMTEEQYKIKRNEQRNKM